MATKNEKIEVIDSEKMTELAAKTAAVPLFKTDSSGNAVLDFKTIAQEAGVVGTPLQALKKLTTDDVVGQTITLAEVNVAQAMTKEGEIVLYPVCRFEEFPDCFYGGGGLLTKTIMTWMLASGDTWRVGVPENLNGYLAQAGGVPMILTRKPNTMDRSRQDYVMVSLL